MKWSFAVDTLEQLHQVAELGAAEVILGPPALSRLGRCKDWPRIAKRAKEIGLKVVLEWDILMCQRVWEDAIYELTSVSGIDALRVQDPGAIAWAKDHTDFPIQVILEQGNHNTRGLKQWTQFLGDRLDRVVLSTELPAPKLVELVKTLNYPCELLVLGQILLFYTPRALLSATREQVVSPEYLEVLGTSEESPHKGFPIVENRHGTFMFHVRSLCLGDHLQELDGMGMSYGRIDWRRLDQSQLIYVSRLLKGEKISAREGLSTHTIGFFKTNKTDVLFPKLKNYRLAREDSRYIGEVLHSERDRGLVVAVRSGSNSLSLGRTIELATPEGKCVRHVLQDIRALDGNPLDVAGAETIVRLPFVKGIVAKSVALIVE